MIKYLITGLILSYCSFGFGQSSSFVVVSSSEANESSAFTVGEIFVAG